MYNLSPELIETYKCALQSGRSTWPFMGRTYQMVVYCTKKKSLSLARAWKVNWVCHWPESAPAAAIQRVNFRHKSTAWKGMTHMYEKDIHQKAPVPGNKLLSRASFLFLFFARSEMFFGKWNVRKQCSDVQWASRARLCDIPQIQRTNTRKKKFSFH